VLTVDRLALRLPAGFERRARRLAELAAAELATATAAAGLPPGETRLSRLAAAPVAISPGASDAEIARRIASAVAGALGRALGLPGEPASGAQP
jgi:hypothetical protein